MEKSTIADYYASQHILITGATGFMGKILIEKLLRSCPQLTTIYLLIRPKKGKRAKDRIDDIINSPVFDKIRDQPDGEKLLNKLHCIGGDVLDIDLGLSPSDLELVRANVQTIFHMAANVRFDQSLKAAVNMNTGGTMHLLDLAVTFVDLKAFVHVSTTYCHCDETELLEKVYAPPHSPRKILDLVAWMDDEFVRELTPKLLGNSPNTYAYTKALTEGLLVEYADRIPIAIARPSIVTATWQEPIPGWIDNLNGPTGLMVGAGKGVIRTMHCNPDFEADLVPVDNAINTLILIGWKTGLLASTNKNNIIKVYHITANKDNPISWGEALNLARKHFYDNPFTVCLWYPSGSIKSSYFLHMIAVFFLHTIPAYFIDFLMLLTGNKPFLIRTQKRVNTGLQVLQYYTTRPWHFHNENFLDLWHDLSPIDRKIFYTCALKIDYNAYLLNYILGARKYCVHEEPETLPYARKLLKRLFYLNVLKNVIFIVLALWFVFFYAISFRNKFQNTMVLLNKIY